MLGNQREAAPATSSGPGFFVGTVAIDTPVLLAPMSGITDAVMRRIAKRCGAGLVVSEMVASDKFAGGDEEARLRAESAGLGHHVVQLSASQARAVAGGRPPGGAAGA